ncbi:MULTISPECIES: glutamate--tRNA ligase [Petrotoga]|uniref:Glutamate--tRNA ligase n=2 Tax=Petrotoga sibirica TaxID=156202 RepID=A0A4R8EXN1_9BACT|nr:MULTISPECIES: glutamate--tRNA ligase [Petrotoga]POZ88596.1 glutamyl-tRNA synthetase [Petrotoga sibirica DSM 13575]POZ91267.1 glutamyl-tRNA synthetase [Petrotoga sp. SL27]TDX14957.1 glutamyl-tRNA synthetase [Petrotoga sibirica]
MIRVRFAPSPTGHLHVGGLRTALFNWYFAKKNNGKFILRIEDTDVERSKKEYEDAILEEMKWIGLDYDEGVDKSGEYGPYRQSERLNIYKRYIEQLLNEEKAYFFVSKSDEVIFEGNNLPDKYKNNNEYSVVVKFKVDKDKKISFLDEIRGTIQFDTTHIKDFVILRSNGIPVYNFTVVIDDHLMKISHVIRGEDHISNTPKQILIYNALSFELPKFAHLPLILGEDKSPLSKRHGEVSITYFRKEGYLPKAILNYLSLLGWNANEQIFDYTEKYQEFDLKKVSRNPSIFDYTKLLWTNEMHLRNDTIEEIHKSFNEWVNYTHVKIYKEDSFVKKIIEASRAKVQTLKQLYEFSKNFFVEEFEYEEEFIEKYMKKSWFKEVLKVTIRKFSEIDEYNLVNVESTLKGIAALNITSRKNVFQAIRGSLLGRLVTPGLYESIIILGKNESIKRLKRALEFSSTLDINTRR